VWLQRYEERRDMLERQRVKGEVEHATARGLQ
jgi:hypothetical protein